MNTELTRARLIELATFKPSGANTVNSATREEWQVMARRLLDQSEARESDRDYDLKPDFVVYRCNDCGFGEYAKVGASHEVLCPECGEHSSRMTIPVTLGGERALPGLGADNVLHAARQQIPRVRAAMESLDVPRDVLENVIPTDTRYMVDMSTIELPAVEKWRTPEAVRAQQAYRAQVERAIAEAKPLTIKLPLAVSVGGQGFREQVVDILTSVGIKVEDAE